MTTRRPWLVAVLACSSLTIGGACKKKEEAKPAAGSGAATADKPAAAQGADLALLPVDSEAVIGVDWAQLQSSSLWKQFVEPEMLKDAELVQALATFKERCGFDPLTSVKRLSIGMKGLGNEMPDGVIIVHGLDQAKTLACLDTFQAEAAQEQVTITQDGGVTVARSDDGSAAFTFLSSSSALVVFGAAVTADAVRKVALGGSTLSTSPAFVDMYAKVDTKQSIWLLINGNAKPFEALSELGIKPKAVFGSISVTDSLSGDIRARLDSADQAAQTANGFRGQAEAMASMVDKLEITNDGADVRVVAAASSAKLKTLVQMFGR
ncbi:MAG: hypothetical protein H0X17_01095 [Deltaproteobacteria bacterium]|nr:hypothetical protein [Deltaproteobacteria bacterium]